MSLIAVLLADGFEDADYRVPVERLRAHGYEHRVVGAEVGRVLRGAHGIETARVDESFVCADARDYVALLVPGGASPERLRVMPAATAFVRSFCRDGRPLGAVGFGPLVLLDADLVFGRTMTAHPAVRRRLALHGARVVDRELVDDGGIVTARGPEDLEVFSVGLWSAIERGATPPGLADEALRDTLPMELAGVLPAWRGEEVEEGGLRDPGGRASGVTFRG